MQRSGRLPYLAAVHDRRSQNPPTAYAMLRVPLHKLEPGMILARPIPMPDNPYQFLVQRDHEVPPDILPRLRAMGIHEVWVRHRDLEFLDGLIDEGLEDRQREVYAHVRTNFEAIMRDTTVELDLVGFQRSVGELFDFLRNSSGSNILLQKLDAFDNYLMSHTTNACYLALLIGMKLERYLIEERRYKSAKEAKDLHLLGLGCLLHDIGKMFIPGEILNKPGMLDPMEMAEMRRHTIYGYDMVENSVPATAAQVVLNHHQHWDGSGYPSRLVARGGEASPPLVGKQIPGLFPHHHDRRRLRCRDQQAVLFAGEAARPGLARDAAILPGLLRPGRRSGLRPDRAAVSRGPGGDPLQRL